jgi:hypothetical protein
VPPSRSKIFSAITHDDRVSEKSITGCTIFFRCSARISIETTVLIFLGDISLAEEAVQEAFAIALFSSPADIENGANDLLGTIRTLDAAKD